MKQAQPDSTLNMPRRTPLITLAPAVAERIAAGEVIERPVSVVKELIENALDAGARDIRVEVQGSGLGLIRVADDGYGIPEEDLGRIGQRHTTSKISTVEDLASLHSLGFRGEALSSIAAVAELTIFSRTLESEAADQEQPGAWITWRNGEITQRGRRARVHGTTVTVSDVFSGVPARLKFVGKARAENGRIITMIQRYALGYPHVRFHLSIGERISVQTSGSGDLVTTLTELYHLPLNDMLYPVNSSDGEHYAIQGYIGNRVLAQGSKQYITVLVNGRWVNIRAVQEALEQGYRGLLPKGKHPLLVVSIAIDPAEIDVNIHPGKTEVLLVHEDLVAAALTEAVRAVLERSPALPEDVHFPGPQLLSQRRLPGVRRRGLHVAESAEEYRAESGTADVIASLVPLAQLQQAVILAEAPDGSLYLVDQHRAHERVIYEHLRQRYVGSQHQEPTDAHLLLEPVVIEMKRYQAELLEQRLPVLQGLGIDCERFGGRSFLIRSVPSGAGQEQLVDHLHELAELAAEDSSDWEDHLLISLACRSALRRGRELDAGEQKTLLKALAKVAAPAVCPHGSPTLLHYSRTFLINKFDW